MEKMQTETPAFAKIIESDLPILIDFYAEWCGPCKAMMPDLDRFSEEYKSVIKVVKVNINDYLQDALDFEVRGVPTIILLKNDKVIWKNPGTLNYQQLADLVTQYL